MTKALLCCLAVLILSPLTLAIDNPWDTRLPLESGLITYKSSGSMRGKKALYFKNYGKIRAEYEKTETKLMDMSHIESTIKITTPDWIYTIDKQSRTGTREINPDKYLISEFNRLSNDNKIKVVNQLGKNGKIGLEGFKGKMERNATKLLGFDCDRITFMGTDVYVISGTDIPLKTSGSAMGINVSETALSVKKGIPPAKAFKLPKIHYDNPIQTEAELQQQARDIIRSILEDRPLQISDQDSFEQDDMLSDESEFDFGDIDNMSDEQAIRLRQQQRYNNANDYTDDGDSENTQEATKELQRGLTTMFKNMF